MAETWTMGGGEFTMGDAVFVQWDKHDDGNRHEGLNVSGMNPDGDITADDKYGDEWLISWDGAAEVWRVSQWTRDDWQVAFDVYVG